MVPHLHHHDPGSVLAGTGRRLLSRGRQAMVRWVVPLLFIAAFVASLKWTEEPASTGPALVAAVCFSGQQRQDEDFYKVICVPPPQSLNDVRHFTAWFAPDT